MDLRLCQKVLLAEKKEAEEKYKKQEMKLKIDNVDDKEAVDDQQVNL